MEEPSAAPAGRTRLEFHACLARSPTGDAYRATLARPGIGAVPVHVLVPAARLDPAASAITRLQAESRALIRLADPGLSPVIDVVAVDGQVALASEALDGQELADLLVDVPTRTLIEIVGKVAAALDAAWSSQGADGASLALVHGDVRPGTIRVGPRGEVRLRWFGVARALAVDRPGTAVGHWLYMAPERFARTEERPSADVYSLGCVLFEGLCKHHPFEGMSFAELYPYMTDRRRVDARIAEQLKLLPPATPRHVASLLGQMLSVDPTIRPTPRDVARTCDLLAEQAAGAALEAWARDRSWPPDQELPGPLVGRIVDATPVVERPRFDAPLPSMPPPSLVTASMSPRQSPMAPGVTLLPFSEDPFDAPLPRNTPGPPRRRDTARSPEGSTPMPQVRAATPQPPPAPPPAISPPTPATRASAKPERGGQVLPLEAQLTGSWQRTLTPAPARSRGLAPARRSDLPDEPSLGIGERITVQPAPPRSPRPGGGTAILLGIGGAILLAVVALAAVAMAFRPAPASSLPAATLDQVIQPDGTRVSAVPEPAPPVPAPPPRSPPRPAPVGAPSAVEESPAKGNPKQLAKKGWNLVERDPGAAEQLFRSALEASPGSSDANYGLGYALLKQDKAPAARPFLCASLPGGDVDTQREVTALLTRNGLECP